MFKTLVALVATFTVVEMPLRRKPTVVVAVVVAILCEVDEKKAYLAWKEYVRFISANSFMLRLLLLLHYILFAMPEV